MGKVYIHLLCYNSIRTHGKAVLKKSINSFLSQRGVEYKLVVTDNASDDETYEFLSELKKDSNFTLKRNKYNIGFCGAHNKELFDFTQCDYSHFLVTTHDVFFSEDCLSELLVAIESHKNFAFASPVFYRADENLNCIEPKLVDAAGMHFTKSFRHLDNNVLPLKDISVVEGGTGAALLINKKHLNSLVITETDKRALFKIYPELEYEFEKRIKLFDEAFFAYREDADLALRANLLNLKTVCVKKAIAYHKRVVLPEKRSVLPKKLNAMSVRNRFLLQINNYCFKLNPKAFLRGIIFRNIVVIVGVFVKERSSLVAFRDLFYLYKRAFSRRRELFKRVKNNGIFKE